MSCFSSELQTYRRKTEFNANGHLVKSYKVTYFGVISAGDDIEEKYSMNSFTINMQSTGNCRNADRNSEN